MLVCGIGDPAPDIELVVEMCGALPLEACDLGFQSGFLHQARVPGCDRLGQRELVGGLADVVDRADAAVAGERGRDEACLALVVLPHRGVHRAERRVGVDLDLVVLIALPLDAAFPLLDIGGKPGHIEVMLGLQASLDIGAGAHLLGGADQDAHATGIELVEQTLLVGGAFVVLHDGDFGSRNAEPEKLAPDPAIG